MSKRRQPKGEPKEPRREETIPLYRSHPGTIRISGSTIPRKAGICAFHYLHEKVTSVEFLAIGANANHSAMKAMGVLLLLVERENKGLVTVSFQPRRYKTVVTGATPQDQKEVDCVVWYTVIHAPSDTTSDEKIDTNSNPEGTRAA